MEDDLFSAETKKIPADVVQAVIRAASGDERATLPPPPGSGTARLTAPPQNHPPSGTRRRVSADEIAQYLAAKNAPPIVDSYAPERIEEVMEVRDSDLLPEIQPEPEPAPAPAARKRVPLAPIPLAVFPRGAYPAPRIQEPPHPLVESPVAVFLLAMGAVIVVLLPLVYVLLR